MNVPSIDNWRAVRQLKSRFFSTGVILAYHRVAEITSDPWCLSVTPERFAEHLEILRRCGSPLHLGTMAQALREGKLSRRSIVVTLDDGYADNYSHAKSLLERHDVPATIFITTGCVGTDREFWWDDLDRILLQPGTVPRELSLRISGRAFEWKSNQPTTYTARDSEDNRSWNMYDVNDPTPRHALYRSLYGLLRPLPKHEQSVVLEKLMTWAALDSKARSTHRALSPDEVVELSESSLIQLGAHTVTHPVLSLLPARLQQEEIRGSKLWLEEFLGRPVHQFAYPYGERGAYGRRTIRAVREAGFSCACAAVSGPVWQRSGLFQLPRLEVRNWDGDEFRMHLTDWLGI